MSQTMRTLIGSALLVGVGVVAWSRRSPSARRNTAAPEPQPRRSSAPAVRRRAVGTRPPQVRHAGPAQPQEIDGWVTAAIQGHNPGLAPRTSPDVEELGLRGAGLAAYGPSPGDLNEIYGSVIAPAAEVDSELEGSPVPGNLAADGQTWTESLLSAAAEDGVIPDDPYAEVRITRGGDDEDDIPVADRGAGGLSGL